MSYKIKKLTDCKWLNLFEVDYIRKSASHKWLMSSRKANPVTDAPNSDAVVIIPVIKSESQIKIVITKEFRVPVWDYEYGFPAGLIDPGESVNQTIERELKEETGLDLKRVIHISRPVYSSAGMTDESCNMAIVEAKGRISDSMLEQHEDIQAFAMSPDQVKDLLNSDNKIAAKAWGFLYYFALTGKIE